ncbi:hypothetical protein LTR94_030925, partial [Friedmanniomyces endolithicus]
EIGRRAPRGDRRAARARCRAAAVRAGHPPHRHRHRARPDETLRHASRDRRAGRRADRAACGHPGGAGRDRGAPPHPPRQGAGRADRSDRDRDRADRRPARRAADHRPPDLRFAGTGRRARRNAVRGAPCHRDRTEPATRRDRQRAAGDRRGAVGGDGRGQPVRRAHDRHHRASA